MSSSASENSAVISAEAGAQAQRSPGIFPIVLTGFCAFLGLYSTQPLLPLLAHLFHATKLAVSFTVTASTAGVALAAPVFGRVADNWGRKKVILAATLLLALSRFGAATVAGLGQLIFWRFLQGVFTPGVFAITVAYVQEEWPAIRLGTALSAYVAGTAVGGFSGRIIAGLIAAHHNWRIVFVVLGAVNLLAFAVLAKWLPRERNFTPSNTGVRWMDSSMDHLRNRRLAATYAIGFCLLFSLIATFTYVTFQLAGPPFYLSVAALGSIFFVYLVGAIVTPASGRWIDKHGPRAAMAGATTLCVVGVLLTLTHVLLAIIVGLACFCSGVFIAQTAATGYIGTAAKHARALAVGLYVTFYYVGGSFGGFIPSFTWDLGGWPACVVLITAVQVLAFALAFIFWDGPSSAKAELARQPS